MDKVEKLVLTTKLMASHLDSLLLALNQDGIILNNYEHLKNRVEMIELSIENNKKDLIELVGDERADSLLND